MTDALMTALATLASGEAILLLLVGCLIGFVFGILPGLGGTIGLALVLPFTFGMESAHAMFLFSGLMGGVPFGGSIPAILIRVPGTGVNVATTFDGYPMTKKGQAYKALGISATASLMGAIFGVAVLIACLPVVRSIVLVLGPPEFFMLILWGLSAVVVLARGNMIKGLFAGCLGIFFSLIGPTPVTGVARYGFITTYLAAGGVPLIPFMVGLFAVGQMIKLSVRGRIIGADVLTTGGKFRDTLEGAKELLRHKLNFLRSATIGTVVGIIPGIGGNVASMLAYLAATLTSADPGSFGKGNPEGVLAPEAANNAKDGGALLTTCSFGIPGCVEHAVLIGALILHGLTPGPMLIRHHLDLVWALILGILFSNILVSSLGLLAATRMAIITRVNTVFLIPVVAVISFVGVFGVRGNVLDVVLCLVVGFLSYGLERNGFPLAPIVIGFVLGQLAEVTFHQSLQMAWGSYFIFVNRPISLALFLIVLLTLSLPFVRPLLRKRQGIE